MRRLLSTLAALLVIIFLLGLSGSIMAVVEDNLHPPGWLGVLIGIVVAVIVFVIIPYKFIDFFSRRKRFSELASQSIQKLESRVFEYPAEYFQYIGETSPAVARYRSIINSRDLDALQREWPRLQKEFLKLESAAGHNGRPLILDYFCYFQDEMEFLARRKRKK